MTALCQGTYLHLCWGHFTCNRGLPELQHHFPLACLGNATKAILVPSLPGSLPVQRAARGLAALGSLGLHDCDGAPAESEEKERMQQHQLFLIHLCRESSALVRKASHAPVWESRYLSHRLESLPSPQGATQASFSNKKLHGKSEAEQRAAV